MTRWILALVAPLVLALAAPAWPFSCTATGCTFFAKYTEPSTVSTGPPLTNLTNTTVTYRVSVDGGAPGAPKTVTVPASKPTGGAIINQPITDTSLLPGHDYTISGSATATNPAGTGAALTLTSLPVPRAGEAPPNPPAAGSFE